MFDYLLLYESVWGTRRDIVKTPAAATRARQIINVVVCFFASCRACMSQQRMVRNSNNTTTLQTGLWREPIRTYAGHVQPPITAYRYVLAFWWYIMCGRRTARRLADATYVLKLYNRGISLVHDVIRTSFLPSYREQCSSRAGAACFFLKISRKKIWTESYAWFRTNIFSAFFFSPAFPPSI